MSSFVEGQTHQLLNSMETAGFTSADLTKMGQSQEILSQFLEVLRGTREISIKTSPLFLTCEVGGRSKDELIAELEASDMFVSDWAKDIMSKSAWTPGEKEAVEFGRATVKELGFTHEPTWQELLVRIEELGHEKCEPQDGPAIRLALKDQPRGDWFWCAMDLITDSGGYPYAFHVERRDGGRRWLHTSWFSPMRRLHLEYSVAFRLRK